MANATFTHRRREPIRAVASVNGRVPRASWSSTLVRLAASRPARTAYLVLGTAGLAALALAIIGPKRLQRQVLKSLQHRFEPQTDRLWTQSRHVRGQIADLFRATGPANRERLAKSLQSWIGHFHAT